MDQRTTYNRYEHQEPALGGPESRPSLGFPLGTALLLIVIFSLSGIFSCCYHWEKLRSQSNRGHSLSQPSHSGSPDTKPRSVEAAGKQEMKAESVAVIMPGDETAKFIALPCPCQPPHLHHQQHLLHNYIYQPKPPTPTPFPIPLYI